VIHIYKSTGRFDTTWTLTGRYQWPIFGNNGLRVDPRGVLWMPFQAPGRPDDNGSAETHFLRLRPDGSVLDTWTLPPYSNASFHRVTVVQAGSSGRPFTIRTGPPLQPRSMWFWHPDGYFGTIEGGRYAVDLRIPPAITGAASTTSPRLWQAGDPVLSIRRDVVPVKVTPQEQADRLAEFTERIARMHGSVDGMPVTIPATKPHIQSIRVASDRRLWVAVNEPSVRETPPGGGSAPYWREPTSMDVFEPDGAYVGRVAWPAFSVPLFIRGDAVWTVDLAPDGSRFVEKYRVVWK
jgi:hypothetical protein